MSSIKKEAHMIADYLAIPMIKSMYPERSREDMYDEFKKVFNFCS